MSGPDIRPEDYAYSADQQAVAESERDLLGGQLTHFHEHQRFTMQRNARRRRGKRECFDIVQMPDLAHEPAYVRGERLVCPRDRSRGAWFEVDRHPSPDRAFYHRHTNQDVETAPIHVVAEGALIKGDSSPEPTGRRLVLDESFLGDGAGKARPRVAVIDTGLADEVRTDGWLASLQRTPDNRDELDSAEDTDTLLDRGAGHGTFVAGIVQQVCPTAAITVYRALETDGVGREDVVAEAIVQAAGDGNEIVTLSLGTATADGQPPLALQMALQRVAETHPDLLIVAAAGNDGTRTEMWPAAFGQVKAVAAVTAGLDPAAWSSHGDWVDCSAVGEGIVSTFVPGTETDTHGASTFGPDSWAMWTGTSFTAPQVAGAVARLVQAHRDDGWTPGQAYEALVAGAPFVPGYGRVLRLLPGTARPDGWTAPTTADTVST